MIIFWAMILLLMQGMTAAIAGITEASPQLIQMVRGDRVKLEVVSSGEQPVEWFFEGRKAGEGGSYELATGDFETGQYSVYAATFAEQMSEIVTFKIEVAAPPILYRPKLIVLAHMPVTPIRLHAGGWWAAALRGRLIDVKVKSSKPYLGAAFLSDLGGKGVEIAGGSDAVFVNRKSSQEILSRGRSAFKVVGDKPVIGEGRFIWRRFASDSEEFSSAALETNYGLQLTASGSGDTIIALKRDGVKLTVDVFALGSAVTVGCANRISVVEPEVGGSRHVFHLRDGKCEWKGLETKDTRQELSVWLRDFFPYWFDLPISDFESRLRLERLKTSERSLEEFAKASEELLARKQYLRLLDHLSTATDTEQNVDFFLKRGLARFKLGLVTEAEEDYDQALELEPDNSEASKNLGDLQSSQGDHETALRWYGLSLEWGASPRAAIYRLQAREAKVLQKSRLAGDYHKLAYWTEVDEAQALVDYDNFLAARNSQKVTGAFTLRGGVVSHALPLNLENVQSDQKPQTNRSPYFSGDLNWARRLSGRSDPSAALLGTHTMLVHTGTGLGDASKSDHNLATQASMSNGPLLASGQLGLGTRIRGGERQVDEVSSLVEIGYADEIIYSMSVSTLRAFDPKPGGQDEIDSRIDLAVVDADHSHFDWDLKLSVRSSSAMLFFKNWWEISVGLAAIDFRRGSMDDFDSKETALKIAGGHRFWRRFKCEGALKSTQRTYKQFGRDRKNSVSAEAVYEWMPRLETGLYTEWYSRTGELKVLDYQGHQYGVAAKWTF